MLKLYLQINLNLEPLNKILQHKLKIELAHAGLICQDGNQNNRNLKINIPHKKCNKNMSQSK